ncbi:MAG: J domain-containing protein [Sphingobacteriales bacterium]|nr:J domain-containing protein [Sphingobacteriales bacterium]
MYLKDYYAILQVEPSATSSEIKKAYRKLALQFHPDKNNADPYANARFTEIKEAYEILINPKKKEYYLQQRWYQQSIGNRKTQQLITPVNVLKQVLELDRHVANLDIHRMDKQGLCDYLLEIISDSSIEKLKTFNEPEIINQVILIILKICGILKPRQVEKVATQLKKLSGDDMTTLYIETTKTRYQKQQNLNKLQPYFIALATIIICLLIWLLSR